MSTSFLVFQEQLNPGEARKEVGMEKALIAGEKVVGVKSKTDTLRVTDAGILIHASLPDWKRLCGRIIDFFRSKAEPNWEKEIDPHKLERKSWDRYPHGVFLWF